VAQVLSKFPGYENTHTTTSNHICTRPLWALPIARAVVPSRDGGYPGFNTVEGQKALFSLASGQGNTAVGWFTLERLITVNFNTAIGAAALSLNTADQNTVTGTAALFLNTTVFQNKANGAFARLHKTDGSDNTAIDFQALPNNTAGVNNTAIGVNTLGDITTGSGNTAIAADLNRIDVDEHILAPQS
jgi:hypothetical protein